MTAPPLPLDPTEAAMAWTHARLNGTTQVTTLVSLAGIVAAEVVDAAFRTLFARHDKLRLRFVEASGEIVALPDATFPVAAAPVDGTVEAAPEALLEEEVNRIIDPARGLWRYRLIHDRAADETRLLFTRHHAISDGFSTARLYAEVLGLLDARPAGAIADRLWSGPSRPPVAVPAAEPPAAEEDLTIPHFHPADLAERHTGLVSRELPAPLLDALTRRCDDEGLGLHAVLTCAFAFAFGRTTERPRGRMFTALSVRDRLPAGIPADEIGCRIAVACDALDWTGGLAAGARAYAAQLRDFRERFAPDRRTQSEIRRGVEERARAGDFLGLAVTNLGSQRALQRATGLRILDYRSVANRNGGLFALALHVTFVGGAARLTFSFPRPLTPDVLARTVLDQTFARLENWL